MKKIVFIVLCLSVIFGTTGCGKNENETYVRERDKYSEQEYKNLCEKIDYDTIARNPEGTLKNKVYGTGEIVQMVGEEDGMLYFRINVTPVMNWDDTEISYYADTMLAYTDKYDKNNKLLEDDIINFWGMAAGETTYETVLGSNKTVPMIQIDYYELAE